MARFSKIEVLNAMASTGMVPVFYNKDVEIAKSVVKACYEGGVRAFEFTNRGDFAQDVFAELVKFADNLEKACIDTIELIYCEILFLHPDIFGDYHRLS